MKQKTPLQELLEWSKQWHDESKNPAVRLMLKTIDVKIKELLPKEREALLNFFVAGDERGTKDIPFNAEQYFSQTYEP